ncbi:MAG: PAS domain-containing protein [Rhodospirillaceae bacterium]|nr:PAS domain-containing protein [Rhodospirillaceae bacterium]MBT5810571.1 PAS domain-containing protein [Rhodospirillaceae bacterium]
MGTHATARLALTAAIVGAILLGTPGVALILDLALPAPKLFLAVGGGGALLGFGAALSYLGHHFRALDRLRNRMIVLSSDTAPPPPRIGEAPPEIVALHDALETLADQRSAARRAPDERLTAVLASVSEAIVVVTANGQVSLVNSAARDLLGAGRIAVGTSVFAALSRHSLEAAIDKATNDPLEKSLMTDLTTVEGLSLPTTVSPISSIGGVALSFSLNLEDGATGGDAAMEHDLTLHDAPPTPQPFNDSTLLSDLPIFVFDCETTGLDVKSDVIVSLGGVRMHGDRMFRGATIDCLVNPGRAIPPRSTAIHGITDAMVADAEPFARNWARLAAFMEGCVLVGHNIAFDIAHLRNATARDGIAWVAPIALDTLLLGSVLDPGEPDFSLDAMAARHGVNIRGRHTALGDSLVTAELYAGMAPRLAARGILTLGDALQFSNRATAIIRRQRAAGWFD